MHYVLLGVEVLCCKNTELEFMCACWPQGGRTGDAGHLLAAAAAATVMLLDLRRPALPLLTWKHGARMFMRMRPAVIQLSGPGNHTHVPVWYVTAMQGVP